MKGKSTMRKVKLLFQIAIMVAAGLAIIVFFVRPTTAEQLTDAQLVRIMPELKGNEITGLYINPQVSNIKKNTIIVWLNGVSDKDIQITFQDGKTCRDVTANPNLKVPGFFLDSKKCYSTSFLPYSNTSTLQFVDLGTYEYEVMTEDGTLREKGKIIVRP